MPLTTQECEGRKNTYLARAASSHRIRRASTIAFTDGASYAAFNDDLKTLATSLEFMVAALEGMLSEDVRPQSVDCDNDNLKRYVSITRRMAILTQQLKHQDGSPFPIINKPSASSTPQVAPPSPSSARSDHDDEATPMGGKAMPASPASPTTMALLSTSRDAKVGIQQSENDGLKLQTFGNNASPSMDSPSLSSKITLLMKLRRTWHSLMQQNFLPPRVMPVGEKYIKEKFEEMDQDSSGELDRSEVEDMLKAEGLSDKEVKEIVNKFDANGDGIIQWVEFRGAIMMSDLWTRRLGKREMVYLTFDDPASSMLARIIFYLIFWSIVVAVMSLILESLSATSVDMSDVRPGHTKRYGKLISSCGMDCDASLPTCQNENCNPDALRCDQCLNDDAYFAQLDAGVDVSSLLHCNHCSPVPDPVFYLIEFIIVPIFTIEYLARLCTYHAVSFLEIKVGRADQQPKRSFKTALYKTGEFFVDPLNMLDLLAILPFFIDQFSVNSGGGGLKAARVVRLARIFRVFKLGKTNDGMKMFLRVMKQSFNALRIIFFFLMLSMILFGCVIFELEKGTWDASTGESDRLGDGRPDTCKNGCWIRKTTDRTGYEVSPYTDIPVSFWWVLVTQTTVGFGDMYPTTRMGQTIGVICMVIGILVLALPITVIGANFAREYTNRQNREHIYQDASNDVPLRPLETSSTVEQLKSEEKKGDNK